MAHDQMLEDHQKTWHGFTRLVIYSSVAIVATLVLMAVFLL